MLQFGIIPTSEFLYVITNHATDAIKAIVHTVKCKCKGLDTCYRHYMSQTRDQQRFTISEVEADGHAPTVPQRIMWPSIAHANEQLDPRCN